jgi:glycyl-tRNA synthetase beta chain
MVKGYERVLAARLEDGSYFFGEDRKKRVEDWLDQLKGIVFQKGAGNYYLKATRLMKLANHIAAAMLKLPSKLASQCSMAAFLCKADLASSMVFEFPELQGVMGGVYAKYDSKYDEEMALGISEHYLPASVSDPLPSSMTGVVVSLADKIDSLVTFAALGHRPSSASDPLGFRRLGLAVIRLILEKELRIDLRGLFRHALEQVFGDIDKKDKKKKDEDPVEFLMDFIKDRLKVYWKDVERPDILDAVLEVGVEDIVLARKRLDALKQFKESPSFEDLAVAFKRAYRISKELEGMKATTVDPKQFVQKEENELYNAIIGSMRQIEAAYKQEDYALVFGSFSHLRFNIDKYFEKVFVSVEKEEIKRNRLATLKMIVDLIAPAARLDLVQFERTKLPGLAGPENGPPGGRALHG